jgi:hypothetical protein
LATLSVLKFDDPGGADRVLIALQGMQERQMINLEDAAVVRWPAGDKKPKTQQLHSTAGASPPTCQKSRRANCARLSPKSSSREATSPQSGYLSTALRRCR